MSYKRCGLVKIKKKIIDFSLMYCQYSPSTIDNEIWISPSMIDSPHVKLLQQYVQNEGDVEHSLYAQMHYRWGKARMGGKKRDARFVKKKISNFLRLFISIKKRGLTVPLEVLKVPFWKSRFGGEINYDFKGYEIWHGHHRAACCYMLGIIKIPCLILKDKYSLKKVRVIGKN